MNIQCPNCRHTFESGDNIKPNRFRARHGPIHHPHPIGILTKLAAAVIFKAGIYLVAGQYICPNCKKTFNGAQALLNLDQETNVREANTKVKPHAERHSTWG